MKTPAPGFIIPAPYSFEYEEVGDDLRLKARPRENFVRWTLNLLDESEKNIDQLMEKEIGKAKQICSAPGEFRIPGSLYELREQHLVVLPLNVRYAALISAVAGLEWLVRLLDSTRRDNAANFIRWKARASKDADETKMLRQVESVLRDSHPKDPGIQDILKLFAERTGLWKNHPASGVFAHLCDVRNAIVHCGGAVRKSRSPKKLRGVVDRLKRFGFDSVEEYVEVDGEQFIMPLSEGSPEEQIWIARDALRTPVERALGFVMEVREAHFG